MYHPDNMISYLNIHKMNNRATPKAILHYKLAIQLYKLYNSNLYTYDWVLLNSNQSFTSRQTTFMAFKSNTKKVGLNLLANRLSILSGKITLSWLNESVTSFKLKCKRCVLKNWTIPENLIKILNHLTCAPQWMPKFVLYNILTLLLIMDTTCVR